LYLSGPCPRQRAEKGRLWQVKNIWVNIGFSLSERSIKHYDAVTYVLELDFMLLSACQTEIAGSG
jgi:hypothetical protein